MPQLCVLKGDELLFLLLWCSGYIGAKLGVPRGWNLHTSAVSIPCYDAGRCDDHLGAPGMARPTETRYWLAFLPILSGWWRSLKRLNLA